MKKYIKYIVLVICIIIAGVICAINLNKNESEEVSSELENEIVEENIVVEEIENTIIEATNNVEETTTSDEKEQENIIDNSEVGSTDKKQDAIELVKEKWGQDNTVTFRCDSVTSKGEYIIAVIQKDSASVKNYFKVNLEEKKVEVDY